MTFNKPRVIIPGIGKQEPVGPVKPNARKRIEMNEPKGNLKVFDESERLDANEILLKLQTDILTAMKEAITPIREKLGSNREAVQIAAFHAQLGIVAILSGTYGQELPDTASCIEMMGEIEGVVVKYCRAKQA